MVDNGLHAAYLPLALLAIGSNDLLEIVHIKQEDVVDGAHGWVNVARHGNVDEEQRASSALLHGPAQVSGPDDVARSRGRRDDDVNGSELGGQFLKGHGLAAQAAGQRLGAGKSAAAYQ